MRSPSTITQSQNKPMDNFATHKQKQNQKNEKSDIIIHYRYECRFKCTAKNIRQLWRHNYLSTKIIHTNITIGPTLNPTLQREIKMKDPKISIRIHNSKTQNTTNSKSATTNNNNQPLAKYCVVNPNITF